MTRYAYVKNLEPAWVEYSLRVPIPDDVEDEDVGGYAERMAMDGQREVVYGPAVDSQIEGLDQEFTFQHMEKCDGEASLEVERGSDTSDATLKGGPRPADERLISALYNFASDGEAAVLDSLRRRAGHVWEHVGCWTNWGDDERCERCGESRQVLAERLETLTT